MIKQGLRELSPDPRDLKVGAFYTLPALEELPPSFDLGPSPITDQIASMEEDFCASHALCGVRFYQENVPLYPAFSFAAAKKLEGDTESWGCDLRDIARSATKLGMVETSLVPPEVLNLSPKDKRDYLKYPPSLRASALFHLAESYWSVRGQYDAYDDLRVSLWKFRQSKRAVLTGVKWSWPLTDYILDSVGEGYGHALRICGFVEDSKEHPEGLIAENSAGQSAGRNGRHIITRKVINEYAEKFGMFTFTDMPVSTAKYSLDNKITEKDNWVSGLLKAFLRPFRGQIT